MHQRSSVVSFIFTPTYTRLNSRINALAHKCYLTGCLITARPTVLWCYTTCPAAQVARGHKTPLCHYKLYTFAHLSCSLHKSQTASDCCTKHTCPETQLHRNKTGTPQKNCDMKQGEQESFENVFFPHSLQHSRCT